MVASMMAKTIDPIVDSFLSSLDRLSLIVDFEKFIE